MILFQDFLGDFCQSKHKKQDAVTNIHQVFNEAMMELLFSEGGETPQPLVFNPDIVENLFLPTKHQSFEVRNKLNLFLIA